MTKKEKHLFRYMYLTLGFYATKHNYETGTLGVDGVYLGIWKDRGEQAREAMEQVVEAGLKPEDCGGVKQDFIPLPKGLTCRGSILLGTACMRCERCAEELKKWR